jgi:hypothetical protein
MPGVSQSPQRCLDVVPALLVLEATPDQFGDEGAPLPSTDSPVEFRDQGVVERYV